VTNTWYITCAGCGLGVSAEVLAGWPTNVQAARAPAAAVGSTLWLKCPHCSAGSIKTKDNVVYPVAPVGRAVANLPPDVAQAWQEARVTHNAGAYTAAEIMCRKILMHLAVDQADAQPGASFASYVDALEAKGFITTGLKGVIDQVRKRGNVANHELAASSKEDSLTTITITGHLLEAMYELPGMAPQPVS
jgi:hypothetical protein